MVVAETKQRVQELGFDIVASTPEEFTAQVKTEVEKWGKVIKASGLKAE
jgi:tripartite-type tricarboxylate transporter receptor subunit TctC